MITACGVPTNLSETENWEEIKDLGFGFYLGNELLPFTPYHDYDQGFFLNVIEALHPGEHIECIVRSSACCS